MSILALAALLALAPAQPTPSVVERHVTGHPIHYFVSLPAGWTREKSWPVVVVIPDAYREFEQTATAFAAARGDAPFIVVVPVVLSSGGQAQKHKTDFDYPDETWAYIDRVGNCRFDDEGLTAVLGDVHEQFGGESRVFITGWEAGGHSVLAEVFNHPESVRGAVAVTPNFQSRCVSSPRAAKGEQTRVPLRAFHGSADEAWGGKDTPFVVTQWRTADSLARAMGYTNVRDTTIAGEGPGSLAAAVMKYFAQLLGG